MKRTLLITGIVLVVLIGLAVGLVASAFVGRQPVAEGLTINGIRFLKDGIVGVAVVAIGEKEVALIDAGTDTSGKAILAELSRRHLGADAVTAIFLTHGHQDHTAAIHLFPAAQVMALEAEVGVVEGREGTRGPVTRLFTVKPTGVKVTHPLHDGETVTLGAAQFRVFAMPGHTRGSAAYLVNGVLLLGDAADAASDGKIQGSPWVFSDSQAEDRASLIRLNQQLLKEHADVQAIAFAHSGVLKGGLAPLTAFAHSSDGRN
jgi:glyoxylase-like metal-dependent hydrolase (beta-lactamase superfamily II)